MRVWSSTTTSHPSLSGEVKWRVTVEHLQGSLTCNVTATVDDAVSSASGRLDCPPQTIGVRNVTLEFGGSFSCGSPGFTQARYSPVRRYPRTADTARSTSVCEL